MRQELPEVRLPRGRCTSCRLPKGSCLCGELPRIDTRTRLLVVIHWREYVRLSNTGHLAASILPRAELHLRGLPGASFVKEETHEGNDETMVARRLLLYTPPDAPDTSPSHAGAPLSSTHRPRDDEKLTLLIPDGSWSQTRRMVRREPIFAGAEMVTLPEGAPSRYRLRQAPEAGMLSTFEAIARALAFLEDDQSIEARMETFFVRWVEGMMASRRSGRPLDPRR